MLRKLLMVLGVLVVIFAVGFVFLVQELNRTEQIMAGVIVNPQGISDLLQTLADGEYIGEFRPTKLVSAKVSVTVADHKVTSITLMEHSTMRGKAAEGLTEVVVAAQSVAVDLVSGATASSKVILKAIENALGGDK